MNKIEKRDYNNLAKSKKVLWLGNKLPKTTYAATHWECLLCGRGLSKSYQRMKNYPNACRCRSGTIKTPDDYKKLASVLSERFSATFTFPSQDYPKNTYGKVTWVVNGVEVIENYHNLAYYDSLPEHVKKLL